jgi:hypothetical protein
MERGRSEIFHTVGNSQFDTIDAGHEMLHRHTDFGDVQWSTFGFVAVENTVIVLISLKSIVIIL